MLNLKKKWMILMKVYIMLNKVKSNVAKLKKESDETVKKK